MSDIDYKRRFGGVSRLYGETGLTKMQAAHICVIGIGGVGSWAAEALARNAVGEITLIDLDNIAESNVNRQIHALEGEFGKAKVAAMAQRIHAINPWCKVHEIEDFVTPENVDSMLNRSFDVVLDAIDNAKTKVAIAAYCRENKITLITTGGAGGRLNVTKLKVADLAEVQGDKLLAKVRHQLRRDFHFPKATSSKKSEKFGIQAVYSDEQTIKPDALETSCNVTSADAKNSAITGLNCAGYGSSVCVTASFGFVAVSLVLQQLLEKVTIS